MTGELPISIKADGIGGRHHVGRGGKEGNLTAETDRNGNVSLDEGTSHLHSAHGHPRTGRRGDTTGSTASAIQSQRSDPIGGHGPGMNDLVLVGVDQLYCPVRRRRNDARAVRVPIAHVDGMGVDVGHLAKEGHGLAIVEDDGLVGADADQLGAIAAVPDAEDGPAAVLVLGDGRIANDADEGRSLVEQDARIVGPTGSDPHWPVGLEGTRGGLGPRVLGQLTARDAGVPLNDTRAQRRGVGLAALPDDGDPLGLEIPRYVSDGTSEGRGEVQTGQMLLIVIRPDSEAASRVGTCNVASRRGEAGGSDLRGVATVHKGAHFCRPLDAALPLGDCRIAAVAVGTVPIQLPDDDEPPAGVEQDGPISVDPPAVAVQNARLSPGCRRQRRAERRQVASLRDAGVGRVHFDWHYYQRTNVLIPT